MPAAAPVPAITSRTQYDVLRLFVEGKTEIEIADFTTLAQRVVTRTINELCAGDLDLARQMVTAHERRASMVAAAQGRPGVPGMPRTTQVPPLPGQASTNTAADPRPPDVLAALLAAAAASPNRRTQTLGTKVRALVDDLRAELRRESQAAEAQRRVDELAAELERARERLRAASGRPARPATPPAGERPTAPEVPAKTVRAWARDHGVDVPALGRVPRAVMDAYLKANPGHDSGGQ
ncbi:histone-like nucleoid-structuring protein Lsr2 [Micromonospora sp. RTP1Z1]|uniref:Lsr2 family DNA-binding protein n=1 Tax=Micromonospora sp. RTP1Z1 TaxID=2994043 RepID=UPI0029C7FF9C|nr:histone-like nucleoid-structuring protein Lsr2 [Micromonospora sp. RTP1Z1]